ncbi:hypothetical protein [Streptomyces tanashiensis]|uniref:hypothetical protein n=1 Tax=Streptomyces tanashiensis TaxID=67367 RepID=UPI00167DAA07|nr:hypothetical protein [Streptomyces tanashiensis]GGY51972.1 hypothetical protein GCM10010299_67720 [Streptomyces tanashiensis]
MAAKKRVEYSLSVPADSTASIAINHTPNGTVATIETEDGRFDWGRLEHEVPDED